MSLNDDASTKFHNLKEIAPGTVAQLQVSVPNIKLVLADYLSERLSKYKLKYPIKVYTDFPPIVNMYQRIEAETSRVEIKNPRFVSITQLSSSLRLMGIGDLVDTIKVEGIPKEMRYGWVETQQIEVSYWSIDAMDRDFGGDLIKLLILEAHRTNYFLKNGIFSMKFRNSYDGAEDIADLNKSVYIHVANFEFMRVFFGTLDETKDYETILNGIEIETTWEINPNNDYQEATANGARVESASASYVEGPSKLQLDSDTPTISGPVTYDSGDKNDGSCN